MRPIRDLVVEALRSRGVTAEGCTDGYCDIAGPARGMQTNGGCHCLEDVRPPSLRRELRAALKAEREQEAARVREMPGGRGAR